MAPKILVLSSSSENGKEEEEDKEESEKTLNDVGNDDNEYETYSEESLHSG
jgi:hypothetical protein